MCGLFGIIADRGRFSREQVQSALDTIAHRGPDSSGILLNQLPFDRECWLGHRRLAILDLSPTGYQPMVGSKGERRDAYSIVFNGEIYNYESLRRELTSDWQFHSRSDTEVLLAGLANQGPSFVSKLNAMLAFAFLDLNRNSLILGRDRLGKKPLYIYKAGGVFAFASELKPFMDLGLPLTVDEEALAYYRWLGYIPGKMTIYKECWKFPAASFATLDLGQRDLPEIKPELYWSPLAGYGRSYQGTYREAIEEFSELLDDATRIRLNSDVPIGVFLSGGIDSSLVASSLARTHNHEVQAFTVRFQDTLYDESQVALDTAKQLKIKINLLDLTPDDFTRQLSRISHFYDEPFSDSSQIPTMAIAEATRQHAKVVLTGDGGDEIFIGYPRISNQATLARYLDVIQRVPKLSAGLRAFFSSSLGQKIFAKFLEFTGSSAGSNLDSKLTRLHGLLRTVDASFIYEGVMCIQQKEWLDSDLRALLGPQSLASSIREWYPDYGWELMESRSFQEQTAALDLVSYMRDDVLVKVDRATMAYGIEARSPLLDYRIVEFGTSLPLAFKVHGSMHKRILRDTLALRLAGDAWKLGKKGFGVPLPESLPPGPTMTARWNRYIENQWRESTPVPL